MNMSKPGMQKDEVLSAVKEIVKFASENIVKNPEKHREESTIERIIELNGSVLAYSIEFRDGRLQRRLAVVNLDHKEKFIMNYMYKFLTLFAFDMNKIHTSWVDEFEHVPGQPTYCFNTIQDM